MRDGVDVDLRKYLSERRSSFGEQAKSVLDYNVFDFNHVPDHPLVREEARPIVDALVRYEKTGIPSHVLVFGSRGSGKTLTLKHVASLFGPDSSLSMLYANVRYHASSYKILAHLLGVSARGSSLSELFERFRSRYTSRVVVVLDEVHLWDPKDRQRQLLYMLSRDPSNYVVIMLSNDPRFLSEIDQSVRSTLQPELIHFRNYDADQVSAILVERSGRGLRDPDDAVAAQIAALTVKDTNSDVRVAIKALFYWATRGRTDLDGCFREAQRDIYVDLVADLRETNLLIIKAVAMVSDRLARKAFTAYVDLAKRVGETPCSYVHFNSQLSYLQSLGLVMLLSTKLHRTYANRVSLLCSPDIVRDVFALRFDL